MYNIRYPFAEDDSKHLVVSTTRPETLFGDVAVAVNPEDPRYKDFIGQSLRLPLQGRIIPIIADEHADPEKGTGCVKITPAHDPNDFEVGLRHDLEQINVMNPDASMNDIVPERFRGMDRYACRKLALEELEELGLLDSIDDHVLALGRSYRSKVPSNSDCLINGSSKWNQWPIRRLKRVVTRKPMMSGHVISSNLV